MNIYSKNKTKHKTKPIRQSDTRVRTNKVTAENDSQILQILKYQGDGKTAMLPIFK